MNIYYSEGVRRIFNEAQSQTLKHSTPNSIGSHRRHQFGRLTSRPSNAAPIRDLDRDLRLRA